MSNSSSLELKDGVLLRSALHGNDVCKMMSADTIAVSLSRIVPCPSFTVFWANLSALRFSHDGLRVLVPGLLKFPALCRISMSRCGLGDSGARLLSTCLHKMPSLHRLELAMNDVGTRAGISVVNAFFPDHSGERAFRRRSDGIREFISSPPRRSDFPPVVYALDLSDNPVGPACCLAIAETTKCNACMVALLLRNVQCDSSSALALAASTEFIVELDLSYNELLTVDLCFFEALCHLLSLRNRRPHIYSASVMSDKPPITLLNLSYLLENRGIYSSYGGGDHFLSHNKSECSASRSTELSSSYSASLNNQLSQEVKEEVSANALQMLASVFGSGSLSNLTTFSFAGNQVTDAAIDMFLAGLDVTVVEQGKVSKLEKLDLSYNRITALPRLIPLCPFLPLRQINFNGNRLTDVACAELTLSLQKCQLLTDLLVARNPIGPVTIGALVRLLETKKVLAGTPINTKAPAIKSTDSSSSTTTCSLPPMSFIDLSETLVGDHEALQLAQAIGSGIAQNPTVINLSGSLVDQVGARAIREAMEKAEDCHFRPPVVRGLPPEAIFLPAEDEIGAESLHSSPPVSIGEHDSDSEDDYQDQEEEEAASSSPVLLLKDPFAWYAEPDLPSPAKKCPPP